MLRLFFCFMGLHRSGGLEEELLQFFAWLRKGYGQARSSSGFTCLDVALYIFGPPNPDRLEYPKPQYPSDVKPEAPNPESYILHPLKDFKSPLKNPYNSSQDTKPCPLPGRLPAFSFSFFSACDVMKVQCKKFGAFTPRAKP